MGLYLPLLIIGGGILLYFNAQKSAAGHLIFFPGTITGMEWEDGSPVAYVTIIVQNTSNATLNLNSIAANVFANNILIGNISKFQPAVIPGNSQVAIPVKLTFFLLGAVNDIISSFQLGHFSQSLVIDGRVNVGGVQADLNLTYKVGG